MTARPIAIDADVQRNQGTEHLSNRAKLDSINLVSSPWLG